MSRSNFVKFWINVRLLYYLGSPAALPITHLSLLLVEVDFALKSIWINTFFTSTSRSRFSIEIDLNQHLYASNIGSLCLASDTHILTHLWKQTRKQSNHIQTIIHKCVLNAITAPNPTQYTKSGRYRFNAFFPSVRFI